MEFQTPIRASPYVPDAHSCFTGPLRLVILHDTVVSEQDIPYNGPKIESVPWFDCFYSLFDRNECDDW